MKKKYFILSIVVISAMLLAACGGATNNADGNGTPDAGAGNTGGIMPTSELGTTPGAGDTGTGTLDGTPTVGLGEEAGSTDATPTVDAGAGGAGTTDTTPTAGAGAGTVNTPTADVGAGAGTGDVSSTSNFALLSDLLQVSVNSADGQQVGSVDGVVINRPIAEAGGTSGSDAIASVEVPSIDYVLVNVTGGAESDTSGSGAGSTDATPTAEAGTVAGAGQDGNVVAIPFEAFRTQTGEAAAGTDTGTQANALVIDMDAAALAGAPAFSDESTLAQGWDTEAQAYWSGQGLSIPATGPAAAVGEPVVIRDSVGTMNVMSQDGQSFGQVTDFVVNLTTGELAYAILSGTGTSTGSFYAVPVSNLNWTSGTGASMDGAGEFSANFPQTAFEGAPSFTSVDEMDFSADWNNEIDTYWQSAGGNTP